MRAGLHPHRHAVNLLGNLPPACLDVLLALEPRPGSLEFLGVNMDVIGALLIFLEKRLLQVCGPQGTESGMAVCWHLQGARTYTPARAYTPWASWVPHLAVAALSIRLGRHPLLPTS